MNQNSKHTVGPWYFRPEEPSVECEREGFFITIAQCGSSRTLTSEEMKANATLIASAPDLLRQRDELASALKAIDKLTCNVPCMSMDQQKSFESHPKAEAYRVELNKLILAIRDIARQAKAPEIEQWQPTTESV